MTTPSAAAAADGTPPWTVTALTAACVALSAALLLMCAVDVPYFLRALSSYVAATCYKSRLLATDAAVYSSACLTTDLDVYLSHMNNARYLREIDLARIEFVLRTGMWPELRRRGGSMFTIANSVRYRKFVRTFSRYEIRTRVVFWDDVSLFFEHRFVSKADGFVRAVAHNRQRVVGCGADELMRALIDGGGGGGGRGPAGPRKPPDAAAPCSARPECPLDVHHWIQANLMSSAILKAECGRAVHIDGAP